MFSYWIISMILTVGLTNPIVTRVDEGSTYCDFYDGKNCSDPSQGCSETEQCISEDPATVNHCFVAWRLDNSTKKITVLRKGCFLDGKECEENNCVDKSHARKRNIFFCCCRGDMCNENFTWTPKPIVPLKTNEQNQLETNETKSEIYDDDSTTVALPTLLIAIVAGIVFLTLYCCSLRRESIENRPDNEKIKQNSKSSLTSHPRLGTVDLLEIKAHGNFGKVWKARMSNDIVAAKIFLSHQENSWQTERDVFRLPRMNHRDILEFIGIDKKFNSKETELWLVTAYHEKGSLCNYLRANVLSWSELLRIAKSMMRGLAHLHDEIPSNKISGFKPSVAHRDFKSQNILLKPDMTACIADFGLSLIFHPDEPTGCRYNRVGTRRYMAPEVLQGAIDFKRDSFLRIDMYACGLVLWELASRCRINDTTVQEYGLPFEREVGTHPTLDDMLNTVVYRGQRPCVMETWRRHPGLRCLCDTMEECWDADSDARPSASCVLERIRNIDEFNDVNSSIPRIVIDLDDYEDAHESVDLCEDSSIEDAKDTSYCA